MHFDQRREPIGLRRKVLRRFYEPVLLLNALGQVRGSRIKPDLHSSNDELNKRKLRRSFADGIAYISAYQKSPNYVTAAALERTPQGTTIWIAANVKVEPRVIEFLTGVVQDLSFVSRQNNALMRSDAASNARRDLTEKIILFNAPRIREYFAMASNCIKRCWDCVDNACGPAAKLYGKDITNLSQLKSWLHETFIVNAASISREHGLLDLVYRCYDFRQSSLVADLKVFVGQDQTRSQEFEKLYKLLCKISKHVTVTRKLLLAAELLPQDFGEDMTIEAIPSSKEQKLPLIPKETSVEATLGRMFSNPSDQERFLHRHAFIRDGEEVSNLLKRQCATKTKVHAELLLVNHFDVFGCNFLDGHDKYIGCNKPACYLCYMYISNHPGGFALPASHQKIYLGWRLPDVFPDEPDCYDRSQMQEQILLKMIVRVRQDLKIEMESRAPRKSYHADSTAGVTSIDATNSKFASIHIEPNVQKLLQVAVQDMEVQDDESIEILYEQDGGVSLF